MGYFDNIKSDLIRQWPDNKTVNFVFHGHSVPSGYFVTPHVNSMEAYPHLVHAALKEKHPCAVINAIVTAIGGENSDSGLRRFDEDVLALKPRVVSIDYALNDLSLGTARSEANLSMMAKKCMEKDVKVILLTPTLHDPKENTEQRLKELAGQAEMIRALSKSLGVALVDSFKIMNDYLEKNKKERSYLLSQWNHPNALGHSLIADAYANLFM